MVQEYKSCFSFRFMYLDPYLKKKSLFYVSPFNTQFSMCLEMSVLFLISSKHLLR
jgi:hypothetical protein